MKRDTAALAEKEFDLLVIGAGIYGAFAAWDAVLRGLTVALVEKGDFASATSANSLKIIHGGLRYLQDADLPRMRESAREQGRFLSIAPHLVQPLRFLIPTEGIWTRSRFTMACAFGIYEALKDGGGIPEEKRKAFPPGRIVSRSECRKILGEAAAAGISGGAVWHEGLVHNTERFIISILGSAASKGLSCANYTEAIRFLVHGRRVFGIEAEDRLTGDRFTIRARCTLNATGPWARHIVNSRLGRPLKDLPPLLKAIDLIVDRPLFEGYAVGLPARFSGKASKGRGRFYFFVPWRGKTMIGTHYSPHMGEPESARVEEKDVADFLAGVRAAHPESGITEDDVSRLHFGLLPMDAESGRSGDPSPSRKPWICDHARSDGLEGLVSIQGVKYTTSRIVAEHAVDLISRKLGNRVDPCLTARKPIFGGEGKECNAREEKCPEDRPKGIPETALRHLALNYGSEYSRVLRHTEERPDLCQTVAGSQEVLRAELVHGIREEMAQSLGDLVLRRTDLGTAGYPGKESLEDCARIAAGEFRWDGIRISRELAAAELACLGSLRASRHSC